jgi:hypothetical protein
MPLIHIGTASSQGLRFEGGGTSMTALGVWWAWRCYRAQRASTRDSVGAGHCICNASRRRHSTSFGGTDNHAMNDKKLQPVRAGRQRCYLATSP